MKRLALYMGGGILALALLIFLGLFWLVDTSSGARFALATLSRLAGVQLSVQGVEGRLKDRLRLTGVRVVRPKVLVQVDRVDLSWNPDPLLQGKLMVHELAISGVRIQDDTPLSTKAPDMRWPKVAGWVRRMDARVTRFSLKGVSYRHLQEEPATIKELAASLALEEGLLTLSGGSVTAAQGSVSGELVAGLWHPSLKLDLRMVPSHPMAEMDTFSVQARLLPGKDPEQLAGPVALAGRSGGAQRLELNADLGVTNTGFNFRRLRVVRPGRPGTLTGSGSMTLTQAEPLFSFALEAADLDLSRELDYPARLSGTLTFSGSPANYLGKFDLANKAKGWQNARLAADYRGGKGGVKLAPLSGRFLDGQLQGALDIAWSQGVRVEGKLAGRGMDPSLLAPDWSGVVNLDLAGTVQVPEKGTARGTLSAKLLESRLQGRALRGELQGSFAGEKVVVKHLELAGKGFDLRGSGELDRRFEFQADVSDLSGLVPGGAGALDAGGWLAWRDGILSGALSGEGRNIAAAGMSVAAVDLDARMGEGKGYPVYLKASMNRLRMGRARVETALVTLQGTAERHTLQAEIASRGGHLETTLSGGYGEGLWRGEITRLSGADGVGPFALTRPATLLVGGGRFTLSPLVVNGAPGERLELAGSRNRDQTGALAGSWSGLNLARANLWLDGVELSGGSSGRLDMRFLPGGRIALNGRAEADGAMVVDGHRVALERFMATAEGGASGLTVAADLSLQGDAGAAHLDFHSPSPARLSLPDRGDLALNWSNLDLGLLRPFVPPDAVLQGRGAGSVTGKLLPGGMLDLTGHGAISEGHLNLLSQGEEFDLSLDQAELDFSWRDPAAGAPRGQGELTLHGRAAATGTYTANGERILAGNGTLRIDADRRGSRASLDLALDEGGELRGAFSSDAPATAGVPETGDLSVSWSGIRPELVRPWLPGALNLQGELHGEATGKLMPGKRLELAGEAGFSQGRATWQGGNGEVSANLRSATLTFAWRGESLTGELELALADYGRARGNFLLPIPARLPVTPNQGGALQGALSGKVQERGFLTALLPGLVQETSGTLDLDLRLAGVWSAPSLTGRLQLTDGGAYLPSAGIRLTGVQLLAQLERDQIRVERLRAVSGGGELVGNLLLRLKGWEVAGFSGSLSGQRFQTIHLPELEMFTSPQLTFEGDGKRITLKGEVGIPEMLISGPPVRQTVTASPDVVFEGAPPRGEEGGAFPLVLDGRVRVVLGDKVRVAASGIDARLGGSMDLVLDGIDNISSSGEIRVVEGRYRAYGMDLEIVRGRLYYVEDPVDRPTLDILALRKVGDVSAGVTVGGFLKAPVVKLYSEPPLPEVDILAYMVLGHPLGSSGEQGSLVATAAAGLFSFGKAESLQEQIKDRLGLTTLGVETLDTSKAGRMGYKEISTTPGAAAQEPSGGESLFTVGKYLTPKLYLSYGRSLITGENIFRLRFDIHRRWQIETQSGSESGADIYYKMVFD